MSNGGKVGRPAEPAANTEITKESLFVPRRGVAAEREAAAAQISRTMKVWRKVAGEKKAAEEKDAADEKEGTEDAKQGDEAAEEKKGESEAREAGAKEDGDAKQGDEGQEEDAANEKVHAKLEPGAKVFRAIDPKLLALAKKYDLNANSPTSMEILNNMQMTCEAFIGAYRKGSILKEFPGDYLKMTVQAALDADKSKVRKLLTDGRFAK